MRSYKARGSLNLDARVRALLFSACLYLFVSTSALNSFVFINVGRRAQSTRTR